MQAMTIFSLDSVATSSHLTSESYRMTLQHLVPMVMPLAIMWLRSKACIAGGSNKATAAELRARLLRNNQPSLTLGPKPTQDSAAANSAAAVLEPGSKSQSVQLSGLDSKGRAVPGAFGRALAGEGAPEGGRKPKRVSP